MDHFPPTNGDVLWPKAFSTIQPFSLYSKFSLQIWFKLLIHEWDYKSNSWTQNLHNSFFVKFQPKPRMIR